MLLLYYLYSHWHYYDWLIDMIVSDLKVCWIWTKKNQFIESMNYSNSKCCRTLYSQYLFSLNLISSRSTIKLQFHTLSIESHLSWRSESCMFWTCLNSVELSCMYVYDSQVSRQVLAAKITLLNLKILTTDFVPIPPTCTYICAFSISIIRIAYSYLGDNNAAKIVWASCLSHGVLFLQLSNMAGL